MSIKAPIMYGSEPKLLYTNNKMFLSLCLSVCQVKCPVFYQNISRKLRKGFW